MVVSRMNSVPNILRDLKALERRQREKKERQIVGADAVRTFKVSTGATWDFSGVLPESGSIRFRQFIVTFTPDGNSAGLGVYVKREVVGQPSVILPVSVIGRYVYNTKSQQWLVRIQHHDPNTVRAKFYVTATGKGSISVI